jgi:hypothetical protein
MLQEADGLILLDLRGVPMRFSFDHKWKKFSPALSSPVAVLYNPDNNPDLTRLGRQDLARGIYPTTAQILLDFLVGQSQMVLNADPDWRTALSLHQSDKSAIQRILQQFHRSVIDLLHSLQLTGTSAKLHKHHLSHMAAVTVFFLNRWMNSLLRGDLQFLILNFDNHWALHYQKLCSPTSGQLYPLGHALFILAYLCTGCGSRGAHAMLICPKCKIDRTTSSSSSTKALNDAAFKVFLDWKSKDPSRKSVNVERYIKEQNITVGVIHPLKVSATSDPYDNASNFQNLVPPHSWATEDSFLR